MLANVRLLLAALWAGSVWGVSYLAAPSAFAVLDSTQAGNVVGVMLTHSAWLAIVLGLLLVLLVARAGDLDTRRRRGLDGVIAGMLACSLVVTRGLQPMLAALREAAGHVRGVAWGVAGVVPCREHSWCDPGREKPLMARYGRA